MRQSFNFSWAKMSRNCPIDKLCVCVCASVRMGLCGRRVATRMPLHYPLAREHKQIMQTITITHNRENTVWILNMYVGRPLYRMLRHLLLNTTVKRSARPPLIFTWNDEAVSHSFLLFPSARARSCATTSLNSIVGMIIAMRYSVDSLNS